MDTWLPTQFFTTDVMTLNTTGVSNDSMLTHEVEANVVLSQWFIIVHKIGIFSAILFRIIWYSSGAHSLQVCASTKAWSCMPDPEIRPTKQHWDNHGI